LNSFEDRESFPT
jgi:chromosome segregation ATPase